MVSVGHFYMTLTLVLREICELGPPPHPSVLTIGGAAPAQLEFVGAASEGKRWPRVRFFPYVQIWSKCHTYNQAAELQVGLGTWQALGPEPGAGFGIWYHLLQ